MGAPADDVTWTERLALTPVSSADLHELAALHADERVWRHRPDGVHRSLEHTRTKLTRMEAHWSRDGLGYWTARSRVPVAGEPAGTLVGVGGCAVEDPRPWWNLYYRLRPETHGRGLATEVARAAVSAARATQPGRAVVADLLEANEASRRTAERAGLTTRWRGRDPDDPHRVRLLLADRPLDPAALPGPAID